ncbi:MULTISPECIES: T6SS immunity protein Tdi1 domain-containing protein [Mesorhizobium]|nr:MULTISPECIES: T6SS immunity protein Tdi1 domain-containing protein [Mesorhizobium]
MTIRWREIAFQLEPDIAQAAARAWSWLLPEPWTPLVCSMVGGMFVERPNNAVHCLDTATGLAEQVANSRRDFEEMSRTAPDLVDEWFLPPLVERLHAAGKKPTLGECYGFTILPAFAEGKFDVENMFVVPVREQFVGMADIHRRLSELSDGSRVRLKVVD